MRKNNDSGIKDILLKYDSDALLISDPYNIRYLSGFTGGEGYLFITGTLNKYLIVDSRYGARAEKESDDYDIIVENNFIEVLQKLVLEEKISRIAVEGKHLTCDVFEHLKEKIDAGFKLCGNETDMLRMIKTQDEIGLIKKAEDIGCEAFEYILPFIRPGITEKEIAFELEFFMKKKGAQALSFDTIVASGVNSACPHAHVSERKIQNGDFVTMDFGCIYEGYCSDMTRTVAVGRISNEQKKVYDIVLRAQKNAIDSIKPGISGKDADMFARKIIEDEGYGNAFGHGLGHGVGLFIHEMPRLSLKSEDVLLPGMVFSIEPGIYLDNRFGVRIEDVVALTDDGPVNLTGLSKDLIEL